MKSIFIFVITLLLCMNFCFSDDFHLWTDEPVENELIMCVIIEPNPVPEFRQTLLLTHYREIESILYKNNSIGWSKVTKEKLWDWCNQGSRLIYIP